jgi:hypothetical protein
MKTLLAFMAALSLLLTVPVLAEQPVKGEVRDSSGKLIYKTYTRGNMTETRDASGKLVTKSKTTNGKTEVRSPGGKLLYKGK